MAMNNEDPEGCCNSKLVTGVDIRPHTELNALNFDREGVGTTDGRRLLRDATMVGGRWTSPRLYSVHVRWEDTSIPDAAF